jgi:hypothetical protein
MKDLHRKRTFRAAGNQILGAQFVQRCAKRSQTANVTSKKTLDYNSRDIVNAREWFNINTGLINIRLILPSGVDAGTGA